MSPQWSTMKSTWDCIKAAEGQDFDKETRWKEEKYAAGRVPYSTDCIVLVLLSWRKCASAASKESRGGGGYLKRQKEPKTAAFLISSLYVFREERCCRKAGRSRGKLLIWNYSALLELQVVLWLRESLKGASDNFSSGGSNSFTSLV